MLFKGICRGGFVNLTHLWQTGQREETNPPATNVTLSL